MRAASREKGAASPRLKDGGSTREYGPTVRRRLDKIPARLPRVGERPAGAEMGDDLGMWVLSLATGDLGCRVRRGVEEAEVLVGLVRRASGTVVPALVRTKAEGLIKSLEGVPEEPLARLAKSSGSRFSESSVSISSALRLPAAAETGEATRC